MKNNTIKEFLADLSRLDVKLWVEDNRLRCRAPKDVLTLPIKQELAKRKEDIIAFINQNITALVTEENSIQPVPRDGQLPLSFAQQRLWFIEQLTNVSQVFDVPVVCSLKGSLDIQTLEDTINEIIRRHEVLRTNFISLAGQPVPIIHPTLKASLPVIDLQELPKAEQEIEIQKIIDSESSRHFNLAEDLLFRCVLIKLSEKEHIALLLFHHIITDGWSIGRFNKELTAIYEAFSQNKPSPLPELPIQYVDFAVWQRQYLQGKVLDNLLSYWKQKLSGNLPVLQLPTDYPRPAIQTFSGARTSFVLSAGLTRRLQTLSRNVDVTLFMTLLTAFKILLYRYSGQDDIFVGSPIAGRNQDETEPLIGFFVNNLLLRSNLSGNPSFQELLKEVRKTTLDAYAHQDIPFELLVDKLQPERNLSYTPLFQVMFILHNVPISDVIISDLTFQHLETGDDRNTMFDLIFHITEIEEELYGSFDYNTDLFEPATISRMVEHLENLLTAMVTNPQQRLAELSLLTEAEQHQLLVEWNDTEVVYPQEKCIHQLFEAQVEKTPDAVAVVFEEQTLTYTELNTKANQLAHYLQQLGVNPNVLVGICVERSLSMLIGLLAILKAGGTYIPLDPNYPSERLSYILKNSNASVLLTQASVLESIPDNQAQIVCWDKDEELIAQQNPDNLDCPVTADDLAYIIYTSGSTGQPKGVQIPHSALSNFLHSMEETPGITAEDTLLAVTTYSFDIAALELFLPIITGARLVIASRETAMDGEQLLAKLQDCQATVMQATPASWKLLLAAGWAGESKLKVLCGGEALPRKLAEQLLERAGSVWNMYGPTETTIWSAVSQITDESKIISIGQPIANTQIHILDRYNQLVPVGVTGELCIGGAGLAKGYLNRPDLTAEKFISNPVKTNNSKLYKTGDLARYLPNGEIEYLGRIDHQVKLRGFRIELGEIETVISQYPAVAETVVAVREDLADSQFLVAYLVEQSEATVAISGLREFLADKLPSYMIPVAFVTLEKLPLTPNGKVDRKALPEPSNLRNLSNEYIPPRNDTEASIVSIWQQLLETPKIGIRDNFFEIGGHSLIATRVISQIRQTFGVETPLKSIFEYP
ncbi:MAG: amino acid adenylation domain-containing protein, partial [Cyanobacteria bacterium P01_F01_bin.143]